MNWISLGAGFGGLSVMLGAFGAHSLKDFLTEQKLATFQTGTQYMGYHALALMRLDAVRDAGAAEFRAGSATLTVEPDTVWTGT